MTEAAERDEGRSGYDAGLLSDYGGGNVEWWWDYIRAELGRAHDFYQSQFDAARPSEHREPGAGELRSDPGILKGCWEALNIAATDCLYEAQKATTKRAAANLGFIAGQCRSARERVERSCPDVRKARST